MEPEARRDVQLAACDDAISRRMTHGSRFRSRLPAIGFGSGLKRANLHARLSPPRSACVWINVGKERCRTHYPHRSSCSSWAQLCSSSPAHGCPRYPPRSFVSPSRASVVLRCREAVVVDVLNLVRSDPRNLRVRAAAVCCQVQELHACEKNSEAKLGTACRAVCFSVKQ